MQRAYILTLMLSTVMVSGLLLGSIGLEGALAAKDDNNGKAKGCQNANDNAKVKEKNPHCNTEVCLPENEVIWWEDLDGDGFGTTAGLMSACTQPDGFAATFDDCDDADPDVFPGQGC